MNKRTQSYPVLLLGLILSANAFPDQAGRYRPMAESMFDMMDAFSSTFQKRTKERNNDWTGRQTTQSPWSGNTPSWGSGSLPLNMSGMPMSPMMSPWNPGGMGGMPNPQNLSPQSFSPYYNWRPGWPGAGSNPGPLDGDWEDPAGHILSIGNDRFRISQSPDRYSEGYLLLEKGKIVSLQTRDSNQKRYYQYAVQDDRLVLRDTAGNLLLFRRISH